MFPDSQRFVADRFAEDPRREFTGSGTILSFGSGTHHCTGAQLAQVEMESGLGHLLDAFRTMRAAGRLSPPRGFVLRSPTSVRVHLEAA